jgi:hypothetical protein
VQGLAYGNFETPNIIPIVWVIRVLGKFAELLKATNTSSCLSVRLSVLMEQLHLQ